MLKKLIQAVVFTALLVMFPSCHSSDQVRYIQNATYNQPQEVINLNNIRVQPYDQLTVVVSCKEPELASLFNLISPQRTLGSGSSSGGGSNMSAYTVDDMGDITFPILGKIHVADLTRQEICDKVTALLVKGDWVADPVVTVEFANLHFSVLGEVNSPGTYSISNDRMSLLEAIAMAGDLTVYGDRDIIVIREVDGKRTKYRVDLTDENLFDSPVYYLRQNDVVYVEPNDTKAGQRNINDNTFKSVGFWMSAASFLMTLGVLIFK